MTSLTTTPAQLDSTATAEAIRAARRFWWWVLGVSAAISVLGNALHAWTRVEHLSGTTELPMLHPGIASLLAAVVPIAVLVHTHGLALIVQVPIKHGTLAKAIVFVVILLLAIGGFYLSWDALRELAMQAGFGPDEAQLFPLLLDGSIAGATVVLLALPPTPDALEAHPARTATGEADSHDAHIGTVEATDEAAYLVQAESSAAPSEPLGVDVITEPAMVKQPADPIAAADTYRDEFSEGGEHPHHTAALVVAPAPADSTELSVPRETEEEPEPESETDDASKWSTVARRLCAGPVSHDPEEVAEILHLAFDQQRDTGDIAVRTGWKERSVRRLIDDAEPHRMVALAS